MVRPKKHLGQHFLTDESIAKRIVDSLDSRNRILEIGPGTGVLTKYLFEGYKNELSVVEIDRESVTYLQENFDGLDIISEDFLNYNILQHFEGSFSIIGNFPYNISSQIFFRVIDFRSQVDEVVCMLQKEVAERIASKHGNKTYGILSVLLQAYYDIEYLFTVGEEVFNPPPKVKSGVIRLKRNSVKTLPCNEKMFVRVVKQGFSTRRKTLRNALKSMGLPVEFTSQEIFQKRAEQLSVAEFIELTIQIEKYAV